MKHFLFPNFVKVNRLKFEDKTMATETAGNGVRGRGKLSYILSTKETEKPSFCAI